ncbi:peroxiredoxin-like family protein [uncultured Schumannella sp.]|uniref:peroxiredoxin-like family protein n=1 Tax=uncultured Schumannella sp. TaxID=1195956 RepID=UPI0025E1AC7A|nr:peroxiredoxin-like family protein [uncultured Schumannella sp.]
MLDDQVQAEQRWLDFWHVGPQNLRWDHIPLQVGDAAPDLELDDHTGEPVRLSQFWANGPALVLFWRHFGCSCGIERAARLRAEYAEFLQHGASVVVIGQASPERSSAYRTRNVLECSILSDPDRTAYRAFDLLDGTPAQILFDAPDPFLRCDAAAGEELAASRHGTDRATVDSRGSSPANS